MTLAVIPPMLAKLARELPRGDYLYEPKLDGFRAIAARDGEDVEIFSRHGNPLARYFPEVVDALLAQPAERFVVDGEIVAEPFAALMARLHPAASRVELLARETPATFHVFDLLAERDESLLDVPLRNRRARMERLIHAPLHVVPATDAPWTSMEWMRHGEGVMAKDLSGTYKPGKREWIKVKVDRTADCVVAGFRWHADRPVLGSLLLGLYDGDVLRHVGVVTGLSEKRKVELLEDLHPLAMDIHGHPWEEGFGLEPSPLGRLLGAAGRWDPSEMALEWVPVRPERVAEVAYTQVDGIRFRHPARFRRWRPDRDPRSCTVEQL